MKGIENITLPRVGELRMGETIIEKDCTGEGLPIYSADKSNRPWAYSTHFKRLNQYGTIVLGARGTIGYPRLPKEAVFGATQTTITLWPDSEKFVPEFVYYALQQLDFSLLGAQQAIPMLTVGNLEAVSIPRYPKPEQSKIAEVLSKVDQAIEQTENLIAKQQRIKTGLMQDLLTRGIDEHGNLRSEETHEFKDSPLGRIPVEWEVKPFNDCVSIVEGQKDPRKFPYKEWILIAPDHIESKTGRLLETKTAFEQGAISGKYEFQSGDVIYSKIRPYLRKAVQVNFSGLCSADMYPLRPKELLTSDFLFLVILSEKFSLYAESVSERSGFPKINRTELSEFQMAIPKIDEQYKVSDFLVGHSQYVEELNKSLAKLRSLKTALMQDLLTGKVRVTPLMEKNGQNSEKNFKKECCYVCKE